MAVDCGEVLACLPPTPVGMAFLGWDGERLKWYAPSGPNQIPMTGPNGDIAWVNHDVLCALCANAVPPVVE